MGNCHSSRCGQQIFGYYPCNCVEPVLTDKIPRRCVGISPNGSIAMYRYIKRKKQRKAAKREGMIFCANCNGYVSAPAYHFQPQNSGLQQPKIVYHQQIQEYSNQPPPPYEK